MTTANADIDTTALVPAAPQDIGSPLPVFRGEQMAQALTAYREVQRALDEGMPEQIMELEGKAFRKKGYWRAVQVAFNASAEMVEERREVYGALDDGSDNYVYLVTYAATAPNGRRVTGDGACSASEKQRGRMRATEHNVRSHAHTRAFNRAVSNLVGFGEVSAEEAERDDNEPPFVGTTHPHAVTPRPPIQAPQRRSTSASPISEAQRRRMYAIAKGAGWSDEAYRGYITEHGFDRDEQVTRDIYDALCKRFEEGANG